MIGQKWWVGEPINKAEYHAKLALVSHIMWNRKNIYKQRIRRREDFFKTFFLIGNNEYTIYLMCSL